MRQLVDSAVKEYLRALDPPEDEALRRVAADSERLGGLPIVYPETGALLRVIARAVGARRVLEIGTAIGYSALWIAPVLPTDGLLISMEIDPELAELARRHFEDAGVASRTSVIVGDASRFLHKVRGPFDLIFQDGDKLLYGPMLHRLIDLLRPGGVLITDNVLWRGEVVPGFADPPTLPAEATNAIRAYTEQLRAEPRLTTVFLPVGDGVAVSVNNQ